MNSERYKKTPISKDAILKTGIRNFLKDNGPSTLDEISRAVTGYPYNPYETDNYEQRNSNFDFLTALSEMETRFHKSRYNSENTIDLALVEGKLPPYKKRRFYFKGKEGELVEKGTLSNFRRKVSNLRVSNFADEMGYDVDKKKPFKKEIVYT